MCLVAYSWEESKARQKVEKHSATGQVSWAYIEVTQVCNFNCLWCYAGSGRHLTKPKSMSWEEVTRVIDILINSGIKQVTFGGGEPLLYPYLPALINKLTTEGIVVNVTTNGYFLTDELARELKESGLNQVQMDIESVQPEDHDRMRDKEGAHEHIVRAFQNALKNEITCVCQVVVTTENAAALPTIITYARKLGVQRCRVWDMTPSGAALSNQHLIPMGYPALLADLTQFSERMGATCLQSYEPLFPLNFHTRLEVIHAPCPSRIGMLAYIGVNGSVYYCCTMRDKTMYNIFDHESIADIHYLKVKEFNESIMSSSHCPGCTYFLQCGGGCPARTSSVTGHDYQCHVNS